MPLLLSAAKTVSSAETKVFSALRRACCPLLLSKIGSKPVKVGEKARKPA